MLQVDVDTEHGGLKLNENFVVDFGRVFSLFYILAVISLAS